MADLLRATARVPGFNDAATVHLIEASATLRQVQARNLPMAVWHTDITGLPEGPLYLVANEFFDALPIRQFVRDKGGWRERVVGLQDDRLSFGLTAASPLLALDHRLADTRDGDLVELCPALPAIVGDIGRRIARHGGAALCVDYGDWQSLGDTLQAVTGHAPTDPLSHPGAADLTAHVDFAAIARAARPALHSRLTPQGVFLERLGIADRARALARNLAGPALESHLAAHRRLTHPAEMGNLFKVMGLFAAGSASLPGLDA
jgi:SAM-dependent MidA family methyltransferase